MAEEEDEVTQITEEVEDVTIDEILPLIGEFKQFQWTLGIMFSIIIFPLSYNFIIMVFAASNPDWKCVSNSTICLSNQTFSPKDTLRCKLPRKEWEYTKPKEFSIVTWYDIYCAQSWLIELSTSILFVGGGIGGLLTGWAADNYGRKKVLYISLILVMILTTMTPFMPNVYLLIAIRFLTGLFGPGTWVQMGNMLCEMVGHRYRPLAGILIWIFSSIALCLISLKAYLITSWRNLFLVCTVPYYFVLFFYKFTPESPRWLRLRGKTDELTHTLDRVARFNNRQIPSNLRILPIEEELKRKTANPLNLFRTVPIAIVSGFMGYVFFAHGLVTYGFQMLSGDLGGSVFLNSMLINLVDVPGALIAMFVCVRFGRKCPTLCIVTFSSIACAAVVIIPDNYKLVRLITGLVGKICIGITFNILGVWRVELFPTVVRSQGNGFTSVLGSIGTGTAPWVVSGLDRLHRSAPYICMSVAAMLCTIMLCALSETKGRRTLETLEDLSEESRKDSDEVRLLTDDNNETA